MNTLIISNRLFKTLNSRNVDLFPWTYDRPSAANYRNVILDLYFEPPGVDGYVELRHSNQHFYEIGSEILRCLSGGGIVIAMLGPVAINQRELQDNEDQYTTLRLKKDGTASYADKYKGDNETSYDWLDQGFLEDTKIDALYKKRSVGICPLANWKEAQRYFEGVKEFWTSIGGLDIYKSKTEATMTYRIEENARWHKIGGVCQRPGWILAVAEHTEEPVSIATEYLYQPGLLVLVPPLDIDSRKTESNIKHTPMLEQLLVEFAESIREQFQHMDSSEIPEWARKFRAPKALEIANKIEKYEEKVKALKGELVQYDEMLYLLCGQGNKLQEQVERLFSAPNEGIQATPTSKGHSLDLFVTDKSRQSLAIEITGTREKLKKSDQHWADFMDYLIDHNEKNRKGRVERIVLVINTQCNTPLDKRTRKDDITVNALDLAKDNHICIIRSCDLYQLWTRTLEGLPIQKVFNTLFESEGLYDIKKL